MGITDENATRPVGASSDGWLYVLPPIDNFDELGWREYSKGGDNDLDSCIRRGLARIHPHPYYAEVEKWRADGVQDRGMTGERGPWYMPLPREDYSEGVYAVSVKLSNNGTTFVWSPCLLPWLAEYQSED